MVLYVIVVSSQLPQLGVLAAVAAAKMVVPQVEMVNTMVAIIKIVHLPIFVNIANTHFLKIRIITFLIACYLIDYG